MLQSYPERTVNCHRYDSTLQFLIFSFIFFFQDPTPTELHTVAGWLLMITAASGFNWTQMFLREYKQKEQMIHLSSFFSNS